jgi:hypothetical protein
MARYREYAPSASLRSSVRAIFTFAMGAEDRDDSRHVVRRDYYREITGRSGDPLWSNLFADAHVSLVCCIGGT